MKKINTALIYVQLSFSVHRLRLCHMKSWNIFCLRLCHMKSWNIFCFRCKFFAEFRNLCVSSHGSKNKAALGLKFKCTSLDQKLKTYPKLKLRLSEWAGPVIKTVHTNSRETNTNMVSKILRYTETDFKRISRITRSII